MKTNLLQELMNESKNHSERTIKKQDEVLQYTKDSLATADKKAMEMLDVFGTSKVITEAESTKAVAQVIMNQKQVTYGNIKRVCLRYGLRFLPASYFVKSVPMKALNDMAKFKNKRISAGGYFDPEKVFVIAPGEFFQLESRPKTDPVILYEETPNKHHNDNPKHAITEETATYSVISIFGDDFTFKRKMLGWFLNYGFLLVIPVALVAAYLLFHAKLDPANQPEGRFFGSILIVLISLAVMSCIPTQRKHWNTPYER